MSSSERGAVQIKVHSVPLKVQTSAAKRRDAQTRTDTHRHSRSHSTYSRGTLSQKSMTGFWHMSERHNRILLGPDTGRDIKERIRVRVREIEQRESKSLHTHY